MPNDTPSQTQEERDKLQAEWLLSGRTMEIEYWDTAHSSWITCAGRPEWMPRTVYRKRPDEPPQKPPEPKQIKASQLMVDTDVPPPEKAVPSVETDVPLPERYHSGGLASILPQITEIPVGGSIFVKHTLAKSSSVQAFYSAQVLKVHTRCRYTTRRRKENGVAGVRIWRLA